MGESLYAILGVAEDADREAIKDAYRDRAKDAHPDVSDADDATRQFKRLTVARDTLLDEDERARYDELGHDAYVRQHDRTDLFDVTLEPMRGDHSQGVSADTVSAARTVADGYGGSEDWWRSRAGPDPKPAGGSTRPETQSRSRNSAAWARSRPSEPADTDSSTHGVVEFVSAAGIWLVLHVLLVCSAVATAIFLYTSVGPALVAPAIVFGFVVVVAAVAASTFHLVSLVYT
ncbi:J domain-containing protein [Halapricum salinum]|uniref:J domain-containing protein n=1 Tax=Halapricum salinum TaxID=1457250 RepID=A0A4D6HFJ4_9EURY|nr:DnaJ domain-containing protein [Halapricum salinum]QCC52560.1 hypothetical protein DV733_15580 [Halapricum salinum]